MSRKNCFFVNKRYLRRTSQTDMTGCHRYLTEVSRISATSCDVQSTIKISMSELNIFCIHDGPSMAYFDLECIEKLQELCMINETFLFLNVANICHVSQISVQYLRRPATSRDIHYWRKKEFLPHFSVIYGLKRKNGWGGGRIFPDNLKKQLKYDKLLASQDVAGRR